MTTGHQTSTAEISLTKNVRSRPKTPTHHNPTTKSTSRTNEAEQAEKTNTSSPATPEMQNSSLGFEIVRPRSDARARVTRSAGAKSLG
ncbi:hypothetical protein SUGI_0559440 [Cryptomeria japonica]|nr:hypothetical protein SUGI_0559330 [Cryptomeria japonica]GLJ28434.1 hypothetical protein SUGI_0559440 [Cryptomeria japonica]